MPVDLEIRLHITVHIRFMQNTRNSEDILAHYMFHVDVLKIKTGPPWTLFGITLK